MSLVLLMEDEANIAMVLTLILNDAGHEVITTANGKEGLARLQQEPLPDIVFVDMFMPIMNGKAVIEEMNTVERFRNIPKVVISGSMPEYGQFPSQDSYSDFICKPFDINDVIAKVNHLTKHHFSLG